MKKRVLTVAAVCAAVCCFSACDLFPSQSSSGSGYDVLNDLLKAEYTGMTITVQTSFGGDSLSSEYVISYSDEGAAVTYSVERFNQIGEDFDIPAETKTTLKGTALIKDGEVTFEGDDVGLSSAIAETSFTFKSEYFENVTLTEMTFEADVTDIGGFMGAELRGSGMEVSALFTDRFIELGINYTAEGGGEVKILYNFEF